MKYYAFFEDKKHAPTGKKILYYGTPLEHLGKWSVDAKHFGVIQHSGAVTERFNFTQCDDWDSGVYYEISKAEAERRDRGQMFPQYFMHKEGFGDRSVFVVRTSLNSFYCFMNDATNSEPRVWGDHEKEAVLEGDWINVCPLIAEQAMKNIREESTAKFKYFPAYTDKMIKGNLYLFCDLSVREYKYEAMSGPMMSIITPGGFERGQAIVQPPLRPVRPAEILSPNSVYVRYDGVTVETFHREWSMRHRRYVYVCTTSKGSPVAYDIYGRPVEYYSQAAKSLVTETYSNGVVPSLSQELKGITISHETPVIKKDAPKFSIATPSGLGFVKGEWQQAIVPAHNNTKNTLLIRCKGKFITMEPGASIRERDHGFDCVGEPAAIAAVLLPQAPVIETKPKRLWVVFSKKTAASIKRIWAANPRDAKEEFRKMADKKNLKLVYVGIPEVK